MHSPSKFVSFFLFFVKLLPHSSPSERLIDLLSAIITLAFTTASKLRTSRTTYVTYVLYLRASAHVPAYAAYYIHIPGRYHVHVYVTHMRVRVRGYNYTEGGWVTRLYML